MTTLKTIKELTLLTESAAPGKFYIVLIDNNPEVQTGLADAIFSLFGYQEIGTAEDFLSDEQKENFTNTPVLDDFKVYAKRGITANTFKGDSDFIHQLWKDIDGHEYIDIN